MDNSKKYLLKKDRPIGHELIVHRSCLFGRRLELKTVSYNKLLEKIDPKIDYHLGERVAFFNIKGELSFMESESCNNAFGIRKGKEYVRGFSKTGRRIRKLEYDFTQSYLGKATGILNALDKRQGKRKGLMR
jgi:hypothetical protein